MSQKINLADYIENPSEEQLTLFAELAIDKITERTLDGKSIHNSKFQKYTKEYAEKKGVTRDSVDLFLGGDMLESLSADVDGSQVEIFLDDDLDTKKGYNHHVGDTLPTRSWFGLNSKETKSIINQIKGSSSNEPVRQEEPETFTLENLADDLMEDRRFDFDSGSSQSNTITLNSLSRFLNDER